MGFVPGTVICTTARQQTILGLAKKSLLLWDIGTHQDMDMLCNLRDLSSVHVSRLYLDLLTRIVAAEWMAKDKSHLFSLKRKKLKKDFF